MCNPKEEEKSVYHCWENSLGTLMWPVFNSGSGLQQDRLHLCFPNSCTVAHFTAWTKDQRAMEQKLSLKSLSPNAALIGWRLSATFESYRDKEAGGMVIDV